MPKVLQIILEIAIVFTAIFFLNYYAYVKKNQKLKDGETPLELIYLSGIYGIDPKKIDHKKFRYTYSFLNATIITITYMLVMYLLHNMILKVILGIVILILMIIISYGLLGRYYLYKEEKNSTNKDN